MEIQGRLGALVVVQVWAETGLSAANKLHSAGGKSRGHFILAICLVRELRRASGRAARFREWFKSIIIESFELLFCFALASHLAHR
jgi:hypothetical protein